MSPVPSPSVAEPLDLDRRQIWAVPTQSSDIAPDQCITYTLQGPAYLIVNSTFSLNLTDDAILEECGDNAIQPLNVTISDNSVLTPNEPYFASVSPVMFVLGASVTIAWILLIMLLMTPRTYLTGVGGMRRRADEGISVVGVGSRPWFQKVATLFVAIALLIAAVKTFDIAEDQYEAHYQASAELTQEVLGSTEIRVVRFISTLFEWLAQAQTALRLFPRHRERIAIKWVALSLIILEMIFSIINNFTWLGQGDNGAWSSRPRNISNAFPALQYLFEIALSLMYAAIIAYYALSKRRFAFYHPDMWNISLVAVMSITSVLVPVVFFVLDIAVTDIYSWGDYIRWVGAAAASVIVWEWVERIEALEREERSDGILGREIYEGDEVYRHSKYSNDPKGAKRPRRKRRDTGTYEAPSPATTSDGTNSSTGSSTKKSPQDLRPRYSKVSNDVLRRIAAIRSLTKAKARQVAQPTAGKSKAVEAHPVTGAVRRRKQREDAVNQVASQQPGPGVIGHTSASPVSRSDCTSASTVYRMVHNSTSQSSTPGISETLGQSMNVVSPIQEDTENEGRNESGRSFSVGNMMPFRRRSNGQSHEIPPEIAAQQLQAQADMDTASDNPGRSKSVFGFFSRFRRTASEERELPELFVPWRGENSTPQRDEGAGEATNHASFDEPDYSWSASDTQSQGRSPRRGQDAPSLYRAENGQMISRSGNVTFSEDPEYANRGISRPSGTQSTNHLPP